MKGLDMKHPDRNQNLLASLHFTDNQFRRQLEQAILRWSGSIPSECFILHPQNEYGACTTGTERQIPLALRPQSREEVVAIVKIANETGVPLYAVSKGLNWGYGTSLPIKDNCVLLDLSALNRVLDFDPQGAWIQVQPGVTQRDLYEFIQKNGAEFMVPTTGAGPDASLLGNALERGYGVTPHADHFGSLLAIEAVLPSGEIYRGALADLSGDRLNKNFKWGVGPYLDGLFAQGNFGVVISCTIALARRPEAVEAFLFFLSDDEHLAGAVDAIREAVQTLGGNLGGINLMNDRRVLAMNAPYPREHVGTGIMSDDLVLQTTRSYGISRWTGIGAIYGKKSVVKACKKEIKKILRSRVERLAFISPTLARWIERLTSYLPFKHGHHLHKLAQALVSAMKILSGEPSDVALPLAYWRSSLPPASRTQMNPAKDRCGLIWYSPLVPMKGEEVVRYVQHVESVCKRHGIEPLITFTTISERCFDSTVPILFKRDDKQETMKAKDCTSQLLTSGAQQGWFPYRLGVDQMQGILNQNSTAFDLAYLIKQAIDPSGILSPGRYVRSI